MSFPTVSLTIPAFDDYEKLYATRFAPEVVYWADDAVRDVSLQEYGSGRLMAQEQGLIIERIIVLNDEPIGTVTARDMAEKCTQCTLGIVIADPRHWGCGYGTQALEQFLPLLAIQGFCVVVLETYANNIRARRCFARLGFQKKRAFFAPQAGRFVLQMFKRLSPYEPIGEYVSRDDPRWKPPKVGS